MVALVCAVVGEEDSAFRVEIDTIRSVGILKDAIAEQQGYTFAASKLQLYLAKRGNTFLTRDEANAVALDEHGNLKGFTMMVPVLRIENADYFSEPLDLHERGNIHVLVVVPALSIWTFSTLIQFANVEGEGGVPGSFRTYRTATVEAFFNLLFPDHGLHLPVVVVCSPPLSGKSGLCHLLYNHIVRSKPEVLVARILANRVPPTGTVADFFQTYYGCGLDEFVKLKRERVVLIDSGQITYDDELLWRGYVKDALAERQPGLRFVIFCSYAAGAPPVVPPSNTFGLRATQSQPGLRLSYEELVEMVHDSVYAPVCDLVWILCDGHIGIAQAMLMFLNHKFGSQTVSVEELEAALCSVDLLQHIRINCRGIPTAEALKTVAENENLSLSVMKQVLDAVATGDNVLASDSERREAVSELTRLGFLYEDHDGCLQFASSMHINVWLHSSR